MKFEVWLEDDVSDPVVVEALAATVSEAGVLQLFAKDNNITETKSVSVVLVAAFAAGHWTLCLNPENQIDNGLPADDVWK